MERCVNPRAIEELEAALIEYVEKFGLSHRAKNALKLTEAEFEMREAKRVDVEIPQS